MKVLYSQLQKYLPDLKADPKEVSQAFTIIGYMLDKFFEVEYLGKKDYLLDLEVRQNRADCFGVMGLVRELSAYYNISVKLPEEFNPEFRSSASEDLDITVRATDAVKRLMAVKLSNLEIKQSPAWLKEYLAFYEINSINVVVDLTNYVMIETGHPSHAFDWDLVEGGRMFWEINPIFKKIVTLDGVSVDLTPDTLLVTNEVEPLAIAGVKGGKSTGISNNTKNVLLEMAVYDGGLIRRNARGIRLLTEASQRLEKFMDPETIPEAFNILVNLIVKHSSAEVTSAIYDNYLHKTPELEIKLELAKVSQIAGITITAEESKTYLERLGFKIIKDEGEFLTVKNALNRLDVELPEDLIEEIIRLKGYDQIPVDQLLVAPAKDITPSILKLTDLTQAILVSRGFDEVRSWVLVDTEKNRIANYSSGEAINVTNSINEEVPTLRQSITVSLLGQLENYVKNNIPDVKIFEIGKVFSKSTERNSGKDLEKYEEHYSLAMLTGGKDLEALKIDLEYILRTLGISQIDYVKSENAPETAHPVTCFDVRTEKGMLGVIYVSNTIITQQCVIAEINLTVIDQLVNIDSANKAVEVEKRLVDLDINLSIGKDEDVTKYIDTKISPFVDNIWKTEIVDKFTKDADSIKYTVRIYYMGLSDTEAKALHEKIFA
ncbi:MAG: phenylalanine--tRNA ligase subunit beta [Candidatus Dojkabacteria bacterium]